MRDIGLYQDLHEVLQGGFLATTSNNTDSPTLQRRRIGVEKFLPTKIPATRVARLGSGAAVLYLRRGQNSCLRLDNVNVRYFGRGQCTCNSHMGVNFDAIVLEIRIFVPLQHADAMVNCLYTLSWASNCEFNHSRRLELSQYMRQSC